MNAPLIERLTNQMGYAQVNEANHDAFVRGHDHVVLFFTEDPARYPESNDVAVVLPELIKASGGRITPAVVDAGAEKALQRRYGFGAWPALVFLRRGEYLGCITRVQDWGVYLNEIERLLQSEPTRPPSIGVALVDANAGGCH